MRDLPTKEGYPKVLGVYGYVCARGVPVKTWNLPAISNPLGAHRYYGNRCAWDYRVSDLAKTFTLVRGNDL